MNLVISGGQSGADLAGWRAAKACGIATGGWMPKGYMTEDGPRPEFAELYGAKEHAESAYPPRTIDNVRWADLTIVFDTSRGKTIEALSKGSQLAINACLKMGKPSWSVVVDVGSPVPRNRPEAMARRIVELSPGVINVAGNRESKSPGIGRWVEEYLMTAFAILGGTA